MEFYVIFMLGFMIYSKVWYILLFFIIFMMLNCEFFIKIKRLLLYWKKYDYCFFYYDKSIEINISLERGYKFIFV